MKKVGVIIRLTPYNENDAMVNLLTNDGIVSFLLRGVYKTGSKNNILATPLILGEFLFKDDNKKIFTFKEFFPLIDTTIYSTNLKTLTLLNALSEITLKFVEESNAISIYSYLITILRNLENVDKLLDYLLIYLSACLKLSGYGFNIDNCLYSKEKQEIVGISLNDGGFVSKKFFDNEKHIYYSSEKIDLIKQLFKSNPSSINSINGSHIDKKNIIKDLYLYASIHTEIKFKNAILVEKVL